MLVELSVMEQRYQAVLAVVQDGWKVTEVADALGRLAPERAQLDRPLRAGRPRRARRPVAPPEHVPAPDLAEIEATDLRDSTRASRLGAPPDRARARARRASIRCPAARAIYRCLKRHGLIELRRRRKRRDEFRRWERDRPMQLWQMDVMGGVCSDDGTDLKVVTGVDDHSRFCIAAGLVTRATSKAVCEVLAPSCAATASPTRS